MTQFLSAKRVILFVDDDKADQMVLKTAFADANVPFQLLTASNGEEAIELLSGCGVEALPDLILMDIDMPVMNGKQTLLEIRKNESLQSIPVVMFTTSSWYKDVTECYKLGANAFIKKPDDYGEILSFAKGLQDFWFQWVLTPKAC